MPAKIREKCRWYRVEVSQLGTSVDAVCVDRMPWSCWNDDWTRWWKTAMNCSSTRRRKLVKRLAGLRLSLVQLSFSLRFWPTSELSPCSVFSSLRLLCFWPTQNCHLSLLFVTPSVFVTHIKTVALFFWIFFFFLGGGGGGFLSLSSPFLRLTGHKTPSYYHYYCYSIFDLHEHFISFSCFLSPAFLSIFDWHVNYLTSVFCYASLPEFGGFQYLSYGWVCTLESLSA